MVKTSAEARLLSSEDVASILNVTPTRVRQMSAKGEGPRCVRISTVFVYRENDVLDFAQKYKKRGTK